MTYLYIKEFINSEETGNGCILLTSEDNFEIEKINQHKTNAIVKLQIQCGCTNKNIFITNFNNFKSKNKRQCKKCGYEQIGEKLKKSYEEIKNFIEIESESKCQLMSKEYQDVKKPLSIKCPCDNVFNTSFESFTTHNKRKCDECVKKDMSKLYKTPYITIKYYIEGINGNGCKLLTLEDDYINTNENINIKCLCNNDFITTFDKFKNQNKKQCNKCSQINKKKYCLKKYGFESPMQNKEISNKVKQTLYKNGTAPCSQQQEYIRNIIGGELNYPFKNYSLDIAHVEENIYIECDFGGHWLSIKLGTVTEKEFKVNERKRWYILFRSGWKEIRIISTKDYIPQDDKLLEMIEYAKVYLNTGHHYIRFDIDKNIIINSQGEFDYNFGELRKIKKVV